MRFVPRPPSRTRLRADPAIVKGLKRTLQNGKALQIPLNGVASVTIINRYRSHFHRRGYLFHARMLGMELFAWVTAQPVEKEKA
jgi:hypothetical protein